MSTGPGSTVEGRRALQVQKGSLASFNFLFNYYTRQHPNPRVLELCGVRGPDQAYPRGDHLEDLTVVLNGWARPDYLPLIWEAVQYQSCPPHETWILQNHPGGRSPVPRTFLHKVRLLPGTLVIDSDLNHGCWFRFLLAALHCRTRYVAFLDDDTLPGRRALETALAELRRQPGLYGGRGIILKPRPQGPSFWEYDHFGWPTGSPERLRVDFVGHFWLMETSWLRHLPAHLPGLFWQCGDPTRACGEDMWLSFVAQKYGLDTYVYPHGPDCNERWSSIQAYEMGTHPFAMNVAGGLENAQLYLDEFLRQGWSLLHFKR